MCLEYVQAFEIEYFYYDFLNGNRTKSNGYITDMKTMAKCSLQWRVRLSKLVIGELVSINRAIKICLRNNKGVLSVSIA